MDEGNSKIKAAKKRNEAMKATSMPRRTDTIDSKSNALRNIETNYSMSMNQDVMRGVNTSSNANQYQNSDF
jgi:hypothetical protein